MAESGADAHWYLSMSDVHLEFGSQVWTAVQERAVAGGDAWTLKEW
jgi:hypothetical protein